MQTETKLVYYLAHKDTGRRLKYYKTLAGARIAQRLRNSHLGFHTRLERIYRDNQELELCVTHNNENSIATYIIEEDTIDCAVVTSTVYSADNNSCSSNVYTD